MKILNLVNLNDIKNFLNIATEDFDSNNYQFSLIKDSNNDKLICLVIDDTIYGKIEFYECEVYINGEIDNELSYDWCAYLNHIFGLNYKRLYINHLQERYSQIKFIYVPEGIPDGVSILDVINAVKKKALREELKETEKLFSLLNEEEYKWKNIPRKAIVRKKR